MIHIGTAAWNIPSTHRSYFEETGSHLVRYSQRFNSVEINSSFYREHQLKTYQRWAREVPDAFQFTVKLAKKFTHEQNLKVDAGELKESLENIFGLGDKLGAFLVQLPGKQKFELKVAKTFFSQFRRYYSGPLVLEPRNATWASESAISLYQDFQISKVIADPEKCIFENENEMKKNLRTAQVAYVRLHGSPVIYTSAYTDEFLQSLADRLRNWNLALAQVFCIFDNTKYGASIDNAFKLKQWAADSHDRPTGRRRQLDSPTLSQL